MKTPPQESRRRSRPGSSTAVASLACHGICAWRLVPRTPRHMPRQSSRSLGCAGDRPSAAPSAVQARQPLPQTLPLRSRAGWSARLRWGGAGLSAASPRNNGCPILASLQGAGRGFCFLDVRESRASITRHEPPRPCTVAGCASGRSSLPRIPPPCCVPPK